MKTMGVYMGLADAYDIPCLDLFIVAVVMVFLVIILVIEITMSI
jgi:hypothetical protein